MNPFEKSVSIKLIDLLCKSDGDRGMSVSIKPERYFVLIRGKMLEADYECIDITTEDSLREIDGLSRGECRDLHMFCDLAHIDEIESECLSRALGFIENEVSERRELKLEQQCDIFLQCHSTYSSFTKVNE